MKFDQKQRFSIRKYSFGAASVLLASVSFMATQTASAEEVPVSSDVSPVITPSTSTVATAPSVDPIAATETTVTTEATAEAVTQPTDTTGTTSLRSMPQSGSTQAVSNQASQTTPTVASTEPVAPNVAPSGSYVFTQATGVKSEPKISSPDLARYEKGQTVNYDSVVTADQHKWLSYISYGGNRRYVSVGTVAPTTPVNTPVQPSASTTSVSGGSASQGQYNVFNKVVYLDAGHGGSDPGAVYFGKNEKDLNLQIQNRVKSKLEAQGFRVELTRTADSSVGLLPRSEKANRTSSDIFVSIHFNASTSPSANGIETYYYQYFPEYPAQINSKYHNDAQRINLSASLANSIQSNLITNTGARNGGVMRRTFQVLRETTAPAVLLELGYMSNSAESAKISSAAYQEKLVDGIVKGISDYYKKHAGLPATTPAPKPAEASKPATTPAVAKPAETPKATVIAGKVSASVTNTATGFNVALSNVPSTVSSVVVPVWSANGGQDDMKVYRANRQSNGQYTFAVATKDHKNDTGTYNMIVYGQNVQTRKLDTLLSGSHNYSATSQSSTAPAVSKPAEASKPVSTPTVAKPAETSKPATTPAVAKPAETPKATVIAGKVSASVTNTATGFNVALSNVPSTVSSVVVPVWSANGGQDDMKVYRANRQSNGQYTFAVATKDHKNDTGTYNMIVYGQNSQTRKLDTLLTTKHDVKSTTSQASQPAKPSQPSTPATTPAITTPQTTTTARSKTIFIDPGHGGRDSGASYGGVYEKNLVMSVANKLKNNLLQMGYNVLMSRTGDAYVDFVTERSRRANQSNADLFVSLHFNATGAGITNASGIETYWYQAYPEYQPKINQAKHNDPTRLAESQVLANKVQANLVRETGAVNRGVKRNTFAVLRETAIPAVLVEMGFMDNPTELQKIKQDSYHVRLAKALAQGINEWYGAVGGK
ncbi:YSIRK-type signal peptide-containing protein [Streptococcus suis]|nr:YSIRK-type signal peptide-containing protein [Streptococcus suis]